MDSMPVLAVVPTVLQQAPQSPQGAGSPPACSATSLSQPRQWDCAQGMSPRAALKAHCEKIPIFYNHGCSVP